MEKQGEGLPAGGEVTKSATLQSRVGSELPTTAVSELREAHLPPNLKVQYKASWNLGLHMVQGKGCRLYTVDGDEYLDCVNNVAHVGHCHPKARLHSPVFPSAEHTDLLSAHPSAPSS